MKRKLIVILLSLTLILTLIPMTAFADDGETKGTETVTITLKATSVFSTGSPTDLKVTILKGTSLLDYYQDKPTEFDALVKHFTKNGLYPWTMATFNDSKLIIMTLPKKMSSYSDSVTLFAECIQCSSKKQYTDNTLYVPMFKVLNTVKVKIEKPVCGNEVSFDDYDSIDAAYWEETNPPKITPSNEMEVYVQGDSSDPYWVELLGQQEDGNYDFKPFAGTFVGGNKYYATAYLLAKVGYIIDLNSKIEVDGGKNLQKISFAKVTSGYLSFLRLLIETKADHNWDNGKVTKEPTADATGVKTYTCKACGKTKTETIPKLGSDPDQMGSDGTAVGEGASAAAAEDKITGMKTDKDPKGSKFNKLALRSTKQTKTSITLKWKSNKKAEKYVIYGNRCGTSTKIRKSVKLYTVKKSTKTTMTKVIKKVKGAAVKKNTYYKFLIVALNKKNEVVSTSRMIHVATKGGKYTNYKKISEDKEKITKAKNLKKGKSLKLEPKQVKVTKSLKARKHVPIRYESSNKTIAKVTSKGVIKALKKGTCYVYVYAQNGVYKKIKVVVK